MLKKFLFALITIAFISLIAAAYFYYKRISAPASEALNAIPPGAAIIIDSRNISETWKKLSENTAFRNDLHGIEYFLEIDKKVKFLDSLFATNNRVAELLKTQPAFISIHLTGANRYDFLFLTGLKDAADIPFVADFIKGVAQNGAFSQRLYDQVSINEIKLKLNNESLSYTFLKGIFIGSFNSLLVEDAISHLNSGNSLLNPENAGFKKVLKTADSKATANIYINYRTFPRLLATFLNPESKEIISQLSTLANWSEVDVNIKPDAFMLNGLTFSDDSADNYLNLFLKQKPQEIELTGILPGNTAVFLYFGVNDFQAFYNDYKSHLENTNKFYEHKKKIDTINSKYNVDIEKSMISWIGNEFAVISGEGLYAVFRAKNVEKAQNTLSDLVDYEEKYNDYDIKRINQNGILETLLGSAFKSVKANFYTITGNYVVFANDTASLKNFIDCNLSENTLLRNIRYNTISENISSKANCYFYSDIQGSIGLLEAITNSDLSKKITSNKEKLKNFYALTIQLSQTNKMFYTNIFFGCNAVSEEKKQSFRKVVLDTSLSSRPVLLLNHLTKQKDIFVQDDAGKIYLIDNSGMLLWKKDIPGKIISDVYQIDIYKNNKLQLLFSTKTHIYLIDRKGNNVENYPAELKAPATNGISLFDYDKNKDYRILIACSDKKIYNYDKYGKLLEGWEFAQTENTVESPIRHFSNKGKDYIVLIDRKGKIYVVDRRGNSRVNINKRFQELSNNTWFLEQNENISKTRILTTDSAGMVFSIMFNGDIDSIAFNDFLSTPFFEYKDVNNDGVNDYIFLDKNELFVFKRDNSLLYNNIFNRNISYEPMFFSLPGGITKIGVVSDKSGELFLFNPDGTLSEGFPMYGNTPFSIADINNDKQLNLITGASDNSVCIYTIVR